MKIFKKVLYGIFIVIGVICVGFVSFSTIAYAFSHNLRCYADSNTSSVGLVYSTNWSTSGMPDYNRVILDNEPFYQNNNLYDNYYNVTIPFSRSVTLNNTKYLVINEIVLVPANVSDLNTLYDNVVNYWDSPNQHYTYNSRIHGEIRYQYLIRQYFGERSAQTSVDFYCDYIRITNNNSRISIQYCCSLNNMFPTEHYVNGELFVSPLELEIDNNNVKINNLPAGSVGSDEYNFIFEYNIFDDYYVNYGVTLSNSYVSRSFGDITISFVHNVFNSYYFNYGTFQYYNNFVSSNSVILSNIKYSFNALNIYDIIIDVPNDKSNILYGWYANNGIIMNSFIIHFSSSTWVNFNWFPQNDTPKLFINYNYYTPQNLVNSYNFNNEDFDSNALYKQDVQWYDIFGHLYNFLIYLIFDMPIISNITKPFYLLVSGASTTFSWLAGIVTSLGVFGAFAMVYLLFTLIRRNM